MPHSDMEKQATIKQQVLIFRSETNLVGKACYMQKDLPIRPCSTNATGNDEGGLKDSGGSIAERGGIDRVVRHLSIDGFPINIHQAGDLVDVALVQPEHPEKVFFLGVA